MKFTLVPDNVQKYYENVQKFETSKIVIIPAHNSQKFEASKNVTIPVDNVQSLSI